MAISNSFDMQDENCYPMPLQELKPLYKVMDFCIYKHKSNSLYYVTFHESGAVNEISKEQFTKLYLRSFKNLYIINNVIFENFTVKAKFLSIFSLT